MNREHRAAFVLLITFSIFTSTINCMFVQEKLSIAPAQAELRAQQIAKAALKSLIRARGLHLIRRPEVASTNGRLLQRKPIIPAGQSEQNCQQHLFQQQHAQETDPSLKEDGKQ